MKAFFERERENEQTSRQKKISDARGSSASRSLSCKPSRTDPLGSTSEASKETAQTVDNMRVHRCSQATSAGRER